MKNFNLEFQNYIVKDHNVIMKDIYDLDENIEKIINEFLLNFGVQISVGTSVCGVFMGTLIYEMPNFLLVARAILN